MRDLYVSRIDAFYSDPHFSHHNSIKYCDRPFTDAEHMNSEMARLYNETVAPDETCLWMGDCFFGAMHKKGAAEALLEKLNGRKLLIRGNHDHSNPDYYLKLGFSEVLDPGIYVQFGSRVAYINHYPASAFHPTDSRYQDRFPVLDPGIVLVHGHTHEKVKITPRGALHAGVDAHGYRPVRWAEMVALAESLPTGG